MSWNDGMGGSIIDISATSKNHINAMDMNKDYGDGEDPVILKSEFILSLCEQLIGSRSLGAKEKSLIDRCTKIVYSQNKIDVVLNTTDLYERALFETKEKALAKA